MEIETLTIGELADAVGVSRRAIRFYVQRGLLEPPEGKGRGAVYGQQHAQRLDRIQSMQAAGHSLESIAKLLEQGVDLADQDHRPRPKKTHEAIARAGRERIKTQLWTRLRLAEGIELHVEATRHSLSAEQLLAVRDAVNRIVNPK